MTLRRACTSFGLPERINFTHGTSFMDHTSASPLHTLLHLWLIALGIVVRFTRKRRPTDHAVVERTHQTLAAQALVGQPYAGGKALWGGVGRVAGGAEHGVAHPRWGSSRR